jgi:hypothetical protein
MGTGASHLLLGVAASLAVVHTAIGLDHAVPFVALSRLHRWSLPRTLLITAACGVGHVLSAVLLGLAALTLGFAAEALAPIDALRGQVSLIILVTLGLALTALGAVHWWRGRDGHVHPPHAHAHRHALSAWTLFVVLVFGPCEALVPLLLAPGLTREVPLLLSVIGVFAALTVATMLVLVTLGWLGTSLVDLEERLGRHAVAASEVLAGLAIVATGAAVRLFEL